MSNKIKEMLEICEGMGVFYTCDWCGNPILIGDDDESPAVNVITKIGKNMLFHDGCIPDFQDAISSAISGDKDDDQDKDKE